MREYTDALDRTTTYTYYYLESKFNFLPELQSNQNAQGVMHTALLSRITSPSSAITDYAYIPALKQIGEASSHFVFKVRERKSQFSTTEGEGVLDKVNFEYSGEDLDSYGQSASWTTKVKAENTADTWTFSKTFSAAAHPDLVRADKHTLTGDDVTFSTEFQYDSQTKRNLPTQMTEWVSESGAYETGKTPYHWIKPIRSTTKVNSTLERYAETTYNNQGDMLQTSTKNGYGGQLLSDSEVKLDDKGRIISSTDKGGTLAKDRIVTFSYQPNAGHLLETTSMVVHDAAGKAESLEESYSYTPEGELETTTNAAGEQEANRYDLAGRLLQTKHADGTHSTTAYDDKKNIITSTSPDGIVTTQRYNPLGLLMEEQTAYATYKYAYDGEGNVKASEDAEGNVTRYVVNAFGQATESQYPDGTTDKTTVDPVGKTVTYQDASNYKTRVKVDLLGRTTALEEYREGAFVPLQQSEYDLSGNVTASIDGNGGRTTYTYDALGQIATATTPKQETSRYFYSYQGQVTRIVSANGQTVTKQFDELGRIIKQIPPMLDGSATTFYYDKKSNLIRKQDRLGKITEYTYNSDNMLTGFKGPDTSVSYTYDEMGRRTSMTDNHGKTTYSYRDTDGMLNGLTFPDGTQLGYENNTQQRLGYTLTDAQGQSLRIHGELDTMNRVTSMDIISGVGGASTLAVSAQTPVDRMTFSYASNSLLENVSFGKGLSTSYQFDGYDLSGITVSQGTTAVHQFNYEYDGNKNIMSRTQNGSTDQFTYDELSRIQTESGTQQETYTYDSNGNRYSTGSGKIYGLKDAEYTYDSQNRLVKATGEGKTITYNYNGDGLLYERTEGEQTFRYYYDEEAKLMAEALVTSGKAELTYVYIYDMYGQLWARQAKQTGKLEYYQFNGHGDVVGLVDDAGKVLNEYTYDIWGGPLTTKETVPNVLRYSGEYWDQTVGLQYLRARWYDPGMARFIGEDTYEGELNDPLTLNLYSYVSNNPLKYVDPSGHRHESGSGGSGGNDFGFWQKEWNAFKGAHSSWSGAIDFWTMGTVSSLNEYYRVSMENPWSLQQFFTAGYLVMELNPYGKATAKLSKKGGKFVDNAISKACNCFTGGTKVQTEEGEKPIEEIEVGDKVLAKSDETGEVGYKEVIKLFQKQADEIYYVRIGDEVIETTGLHPFWLDGKGWTLVQDLKVGDLLVSSDGTKLAIDRIEIAPRQTTVYNFMVADYHSYFVSNLGIWVHNCTILSAGKNFKKHYLDHKKLLENALGTKYKKYDDETTARFLSDLGSLIDNGTVKFVGDATLQKGGDVYKVYRGNGLTMTTKQNGEWHTLLESGKGMDGKFIFK
ncbi:polymorphic toxin-type HINT domain-containing protein [Paenibacillus sp. USHLN196]|uniref:polymorphic toxin-type HINT domain-containing protein n=1 Tax=Paenibacillus sp. USHLN196 TaxID=3081291 RepID=UPI003017339E